MTEQTSLAAPAPTVASTNATVADAYSAFVEPPHSTYPTPLFWWSGAADLSRDRLEWELDQLAGKGIGGTIVGYSHLPDGALDHGNPAPFTPEWWSLLRWFVGASADRGMTTGIQDYGIIGTVLKAVAPEASGLTAGTLTNVLLEVTPGESVIVDPGSGQIVSVVAWPQSATIADAITLDSATLASTAKEWTQRSGPWCVSVVIRTRGKIGLHDTDFDPLHPRAGAAVIDAFYADFERELGDLFGTSFRMFFQDELDLGLMMPMWNDQVAEALSDDFPGTRWLHALWHDVGEQTTRFRAAYRDTVVGLLVSNYFKPIYEWLDARGALLVMDQMSRGDLRAGHTHYADFMETMQWYHGPGNDDPDLRRVRSTVAFAVSASIARIADRPLVVNEAFHSSGWAVTPAGILTGANIGFAAGANHLIMHGLSYSTEAGWWEWASPDFHFRQPWWEHSAPLWRYFARVSAVLRCGRDAGEVGIVDPSADLDLEPSSGAPEVAHALLADLGRAGIGAIVLPERTLAASAIRDRGVVVGGMPLRTILVPSMHTLRDATVEKLSDVVAAGGRVIAIGAHPVRTESRALIAADTAGWTIIADEPESLALMREGLPGFAVDGLRVSHRRLDDGDLYFIVNSTEGAMTVPVAVGPFVERWDPWAGTASPIDVTASLQIEAGRAEIIVVRDSGTASIAPEAAQTSTISLPDAWNVECRAGLDNRYLDFAVDDRQDLGIESVRFTVDGAPGRADTGTRFYVLGPISPEDATAVERQLLAGEFDFDAAASGVPWRPYDFSPSSGIDDDPLLLDGMTGPHGLKGARDDFLDPRAVDASPPPGALYYFCSRVSTPEENEVVRAGSRSPLTVWVDGERVIHQPAEEPAAWFPPWSLRDLRISELSAAVETPRAASVVLVRLTVSAEQPTRAFAVVGGDGTPAPTISTMRWWEGQSPARPFQPRLGQPSRDVIATVVMPPGSATAVITSIGPVVRASADGRDLDIVIDQSTSRRGERCVISTVTIPNGATGALHVTVRPDVDLGATGGVFIDPIRWTTSGRAATLAPWAEWGLADFSGRLLYAQTFEWAEEGAAASLRLDGLVGSAAVTLNGQAVGVILDAASPLALGDAIRVGSNDLEIECANTLGNYYSRWPTPFAFTSDAGGGFTAATLVVARD